MPYVCYVLFFGFPMMIFIGDIYTKKNVG